MRISDKEWKNIEFRKNKFRELESALDQAVSGRDNKVSSFCWGVWQMEKREKLRLWKNL